MVTKLMTASAEAAARPLAAARTEDTQRIERRVIAAAADAAGTVGSGGYAPVTAVALFALGGPAV